MESTLTDELASQVSLSHLKKMAADLKQLELGLPHEQGRLQLTDLQPAEDLRTQEHLGRLRNLDFDRGGALDRSHEETLAAVKASYETRATTLKGALARAEDRIDDLQKEARKDKSNLAEAEALATYWETEVKRVQETHRQAQQQAELVLREARLQVVPLEHRSQTAEARAQAIESEVLSLRAQLKEQETQIHQGAQSTESRARAAEAEVLTMRAQLREQETKLYKASQELQERQTIQGQEEGLRAQLDRETQARMAAEKLVDQLNLRNHLLNAVIQARKPLYDQPNSALDEDCLHYQLPLLEDLVRETMTQKQLSP